MMFQWSRGKSARLGRNGAYACHLATSQLWDTSLKGSWLYNAVYMYGFIWVDKRTCQTGSLNPHMLTCSAADTAAVPAKRGWCCTVPQRWAEQRSTQRHGIRKRRKRCLDHPLLMTEMPKFITATVMAPKVARPTTKRTFCWVLVCDDNLDFAGQFSLQLAIGWYERRAQQWA